MGKWKLDNFLWKLSGSVLNSYFVIYLPEYYFGYVIYSYWWVAMLRGTEKHIHTCIAGIVHYCLTIQESSFSVVEFSLNEPWSNELFSISYLFVHNVTLCLNFMCVWVVLSCSCLLNDWPLLTVFWALFNMRDCIRSIILG